MELDQAKLRELRDKVTRANEIAERMNEILRSLVNSHGSENPRRFGDGVESGFLSMDQVKLWIKQWLEERGFVDGEEDFYDSRFSDMGMTSMDSVELAESISEEYGIEVDASVAWRSASPMALVSYIAKQKLDQ